MVMINAGTDQLSAAIIATGGDKNEGIRAWITEGWHRGCRRAFEQKRAQRARFCYQLPIMAAPKFGWIYLKLLEKTPKMKLQLRYIFARAKFIPVYAIYAAPGNSLLNFENNAAIAEALTF